MGFLGTTSPAAVGKDRKEFKLNKITMKSVEEQEDDLLSEENYCSEVYDKMDTSTSEASFPISSIGPYRFTGESEDEVRFVKRHKGYSTSSVSTCASCRARSSVNQEAFESTSRNLSHTSLSTEATSRSEALFEHVEIEEESPLEKRKSNLITEIPVEPNEIPVEASDIQPIEAEEKTQRKESYSLGLSTSVPDFLSYVNPETIKTYMDEINQLEKDLRKARYELAVRAEEPRQDRETLGLVSLALTSAFVVANFSIFTMSELMLMAPEKTLEQICMGLFLLALGTLATALSIPATQLVGEWLYKDSGFRFYQPLQGGKVFVWFQAFGWTIYAFSLFGILCFAIFQPQFGGILTMSGVFGSISQVLIMCSLLTFRIDVVKKKKKEQKITGRRRTNSMQSTYSSVSAVSGKSGDAEIDGLERDLWLDSNLKWNRGRDFSFKIDNDTAAFLFFILLNGSMLLVALALSFITEVVAKDDVHRVISACLSLVCVIVTAGITHGLGGILYHNSHGWKFIQPFVGGTYFCLLQGITWALFGASVCAQFVFIVASAYVSTRLFIVSGIMKLGVFTALIGHFVLIVSLRYYRGEKKMAAKRLKNLIQSHPLSVLYFCEEMATNTKYLEGVRQRMNKFNGINKIVGTLLIAGLCNIQYVIFVYVSFAFYAPMPLLCSIGVESMCYDETPEEMFPALFKFSMCICFFTIGYSSMKTFNVQGPVRAILLVGMTIIPVSYTLYSHSDSQIFPLLFILCSLFVIYNYRTYRNMPELNGSREWEAFRQFDWMWDLFQNYLGGQVLKDEKLVAYEKKYGQIGSKTGGKQFLACFHPHGIYPTTLIWLPNARMWREQFPLFRPNGHTASIIHLVPIMRDLSQWAGVRDVGRASVSHTLNSGVSPILVVGGQSEMFLSRSSGTEILLHRRHRGFVRMAIKHGVPLLPVFSYGEHKTMDNVYLPKMQAYFKSKLGFPIPYFPYGRWYLPVLRRTPINICVGEPVFPIVKTNKPTAEQIDEMHHRYFEALGELFERNKAKCGFPNHTIKWVYD